LKQSATVLAGEVMETVTPSMIVALDAGGERTAREANDLYWRHIRPGLAGL